MKGDKKMKVKSYSLDEIKKLFSFDDETGVYYLDGDSISVTINSWNYLVKIYTRPPEQPLSEKDTELLHTVFTTLYFDYDDNNH